MQRLKIECIPKSFTRILKLVILVYALLAVSHTTLHFYNANDKTHIRTRRSFVKSMDTTTTVIDNEYNKFPADERVFKADVKQHDLVYSKATQSAYASSEVEHQKTTNQDTLLNSKLFSGAMGPSNIQPYYSRASNINNTKDITITTLVTNDRFPLLSRLATRYKGPISAAIHIHDNDQKQEILEQLEKTIEDNPDVQHYVDIHLIVDKYDRQFNMWRNTARLYAQTDYVMMLDIDFYLCTDFREKILQNDTLMQLLEDGHSAIVVPAFEYIEHADGLDYRTFPTSKDALLKEVLEDKKLDMFHRSWVKGHSATNYMKWYSTEQLYKVDDYNFSYEPYVIYKREDSPWCDERFIGYGGNKAACLYEIYISGIDYYVLPDDFLIHQSHSYPETTRKKERTFNRKVYANFREESCLKYARQFIANGKWNTNLSNNLKSECGKIKEFNSVIRHIDQ